MSQVGIWRKAGDPQQSIAAMVAAGAAMLITKEAAVNDLYDAVKRVWKPADDAGVVLHGR